MGGLRADARGREGDHWGATGDFLLGTTGRSAIDVYEVTLPAPPAPATAPGGKKGK